MPNEDQADIPAGWREVVHPRRHGLIAVDPARDGGGDAFTAGLVARRGLAQAAAAFVAAYQNHMWDDGARHLRSLLAVAPQEVYDEAVAALTVLRGRSRRERIVASYLVPDRHDWVEADLADRVADSTILGHLLFYSATTAEQLSASRPIGWTGSGMTGWISSSRPTTRSATRPLR